LWHEGNPGLYRSARAFLGHITAKRFHPAFLNPLGACDQRKQRGLAHTIWPNHNHRFAGRDREAHTIKRD
jgi:hypothetical protein